MEAERGRCRRIERVDQGATLPPSDPGATPLVADTGGHARPFSSARGMDATGSNYDDSGITQIERATVAMRGWARRAGVGLSTCFFFCFF
jgi:hypothetical protein